MLKRRKKQLLNMAGVARKRIEEIFEDKADPKVKYSVAFSKNDKGVVAQLVVQRDPFSLAGDWPERYGIRHAGGKGVDVQRYTQGALSAAGDQAIPVEPRTVSGFTDMSLVFKFRKAIIDTRELITGKDGPTEQSDGLLKDSQQLVDALVKAGISGS